MARRAGRRCAREGCRAWALREGEWCRAHTPHEREEGDGPESLREWVETRPGAASGRYGDLLGPELSRALEEAGRNGSLTEEIGALRVALARLLDDQQVNSRQLAESVPRLVGATTRALRAQRTLSGETAGDLTDALTRVLLEMELGE